MNDVRKCSFFNFTGTALCGTEELKHSAFIEMFEEVAWIVQRLKQWEIISEEKNINKEVYRLFKILLLETGRLLLYHVRMTGSWFTFNSLSRTVYNSMSRLSLLRSCSFPSITHIFSTALSPYVILGCYAMIPLGISLRMPSFLHSKPTNLGTSYLCE